MKVILTLIAFVFFSGFKCDACPLQEFRYVTEQAEPYNFKNEHKQAKGIAVDLLIDIAKKLNCKVESNDIEFLPWARAFKMAKTRDNFIIFTMAQSKERMNMFKCSVPFIEIGYSIFSKAKINFSKINSKITVGAVRNDYAATIVRELQNQKIDIFHTNSLESLISMFIKNRVTAIAYEDISFMWALKKIDLLEVNFSV